MEKQGIDRFMENANKTMNILRQNQALSPPNFSNANNQLVNGFHDGYRSFYSSRYSLAQNLNRY